MASQRAPQPDGHTILAAGGSLRRQSVLYVKIPYDPYKDFAPITLVCSSTHVLAVHPSVPAQQRRASWWRRRGPIPAS